MSKNPKLALIMLVIILSCTYYISAKVSPSASGSPLDEDADLIKSDGKALATALEKYETIIDHSGQIVIEEEVTEEIVQLEPPATDTYPPDKVSYDGLWDEKIVAQLSFLQSPIPGAKISSRDSQLPGAPRTYRNGTHEGLDYYNGYCGVPIYFGDPVYAAGAGIVIRVDHGFSEIPTEEREEKLRISGETRDTPEHILDYLRGRQVWIDHGFGVITRYAHLDTVPETLQVGDLIEAGNFVGTIGNSGTSNGSRGTRDDAHLHFEIWLGDRYLGEGLSPEQIRLLWHEVLIGNDN